MYIVKNIYCIKLNIGNIQESIKCIKEAFTHVLYAKNIQFGHITSLYACFPTNDNLLQFQQDEVIMHIHSTITFNNNDVYSYL